MERAEQGKAETRGESGGTSGRQGGGEVEDGNSGFGVGMVGEGGVGGVQEKGQGEGVGAEYAGCTTCCTPSCPAFRRLPLIPPPFPALSLPALAHHLIYSCTHPPASAGAASAGSAVTAGVCGPRPLVAHMHVALLHLLLPASMPAEAAREEIGARERDGRGKEREATGTEARVGVVSGSNGATSAAAAAMGSPASLTGEKMGLSAAVVSDASSDLLMCPIDELTWPEVACRVLAVSTVLLQEERNEWRAHGGDREEGRQGKRGAERRRRGASKGGRAHGEEEVTRGSGREGGRQGQGGAGGQGGRGVGRREQGGRSPREQGRLTRCIAGDGGLLLGTGWAPLGPCRMLL
ncbi:unnamed protein product [Closterium sp. Naga37s-1]|nr:unnamed protein product [Closterium sp. Naga37s-1]